MRISDWSSDVCSSDLFMFGPDYKAGCPSCSAIADGFDGFAVHLANHDVTLMAVSRAPLATLQTYRQRLGWTFPWASSHGGEFNYDFKCPLPHTQQPPGGTEYTHPTHRDPPPQHHPP